MQVCVYNGHFEPPYALPWSTSTCVLLHVCVCGQACIYTYVSVFCGNNSWRWVTEMWWPSTGSLEFCQCGGPALIIKNPFTERISAVSVVGCTLQGHIQDNHTEGEGGGEKKFGHTADQKRQNPEDTTVWNGEVISRHGYKNIHKNRTNKQTNILVGFLLFHSYLAEQFSLFYPISVIDSRCLVCSFPLSMSSFLVQDNKESKSHHRNSLSREDLHSKAGRQNK